MLAFMEHAQEIGRVHRIGQLEICLAYILSLDMTTDRVLRSRYAMQALATYAAYMGI